MLLFDLVDFTTTSLKTPLILIFFDFLTMQGFSNTYLPDQPILNTHENQSRHNVDLVNGSGTFNLYFYKKIKVQYFALKNIYKNSEFVPVQWS